MNKKMQIFLIIISIAIIIILSFLVFSKKCPEYVNPKTGDHSGGCFYIWQKGYWSGEDLFRNDTTGVIEIKTFSEISGFTFEYPVFEGWEPNEPEMRQNNETGDLTATIFFSNPTKILFEMGARMTVVKSARMMKISEESFDRNPNGVAYRYVEGTSSDPERITFFLPDSTVDILPFMHEGDGYSGKILAQKIIDSFKFDSKEETLWNNLNGTTWRVENSFAGESYVFFENNSGQKKCIDQTYGSGVYVLYSEFREVYVLSEDTIKIGDKVFKYEADRLMSDVITLTLHKREPLIYNKSGAIMDMEVVKGNGFDIKGLNN